MFQNLLPEKHKKKLKHEYILRLATVVALLISTSFFVGMVALTPLYFDVSFEVSAIEQERVSRDADVKENIELKKEVEKTFSHMSYLEQGLAREKFSTIINEILEQRPEGITVVGFAYDRKGRTLTIEGVAETRDLVSPYARSIESSDRFIEVPIPIADLTKKVNLDFRLRGTLQEEM